MQASAQEAAITRKPHNKSAGQVRSGPVSVPGAAVMSRLQFTTGAGHRRGRARQARPIRSRRPPCRRQQRSRRSSLHQGSPQGQSAGSSQRCAKRFGQKRAARSSRSRRAPDPSRCSTRRLDYLSISRTLTRAFKCRGWRAPSRCRDVVDSTILTSFLVPEIWLIVAC